jgi:hypothetical protein
MSESMDISIELFIYVDSERTAGAALEMANVIHFA